MPVHRSDPVTSTPLVERAGELLARLRARTPKVHCITNTVAQPITANVLLAAGAIPSLTTSEEEISAFVRTADAVLVNLGTLDPERRHAIEVAVDHATRAKVPWLLDPVFVDRSELRLDFAKSLLGRRPDAIRLNAAEFEALSGVPLDPDAVRAFARSSGSVVAVTGNVDVVTDGDRIATIRNGDALMAKVTAMGCAESAVASAALVVEEDRFVAMVAAITVFGVAGEIAASASKGPGTFAAAFIDAFHSMTATTILERARIGDG